MTTNVYIDGFNLYYGSLKYSPYKWLNVSQLITSLYPTKTINKLRYFTARVKPWLHDPYAPDRQNIYFRALRTLPNLTIHEGRFALREVLLPQSPLAYKHGNHARPPQNVQVLKPEEKRSDVNLATFLLEDCFTNDFDDAIVVSNDSDLCLPIDVTVNHCGKNVLVDNPQKREALSRELTRVATLVMPEINRPHLRNSQFPPTLTDTVGTITKPSTW